MNAKPSILLRRKSAAVPWLAGLLGLLCLLFSRHCSWGQAVATAPEYRIKAVYLFNFAQFAKWPATAFATSNAPIIIGVSGEAPLGEALEEAIAGETVNGRTLTVKQFAAGETIGSCHILFICLSEKNRVAGILKNLQGAPVLTVSETDGFCEHGGMINFYRQDQKIKFEVNPQSVDQANLIISSKLLNLARIKTTAPPE